MMKRAIDIVLSIVGLVALSPLWALIAVALKMDSAGPVLYAQARVGKGGRQFRIFKFRSMVADADRIGPLLTAADDARITRVGRWLRRLRFDEIPQLLNVLKGDMSFVGPRPEVPAIVARYSDDQKAVLTVRPGITGPSQLTWHGEAERYPEGGDRVEYYVRHILPGKLQSDLEYIRTRSLLGDLACLVHTPIVLLRSTTVTLRAAALWPKIARLAIDGVAVGLAHLAAFWGRFEWPIPATEVPYLLWGLPLTCAVYVLAFALLRTYRSMWRYASVDDLWRVSSSVALGASLQAVALILLGWRPYPRSVVVSTAVLSLLFLSGLRMLARSRVEAAVGRNKPQSKKRRVAIVGAGKTGDSIAREICDSGAEEYELVGFLDDDPAKLGATIRSCPVLGAIDELPILAQKHRLEEIIVAIPRIGARQLRTIAGHSMAAQISFKCLPSLGQLMRGEGKLRYLRKVDLDELLSRQPVTIDDMRIGKLIKGKRVLVTGAGGSIGSELCRQVMRLGASSLIMVERAENALHDISLEIRAEFPDVPVVAALADVKHIPRMVEVFSQNRPAIVFHAAAYKHVPILEDHPGEAVLNNVVGTKRLVEVAGWFGLETFVLISTDKAVNPKNLMGATKRICEMYITALSRAVSRQPGKKQATRFVMVRFGNVLGSNGSVLPLFQHQIENGDPMTITDPGVSRFFMTIPEAVGLVLQSVGLQGRGGDVFVLDMGQPIRIGELADGLVASLGLSPSDVQRRYVGLRPGEKLEETLWEPGDDVSRSEHPKVFVVKQEARQLAEMEALVGDLEALAVRGDIAMLLRRLGEIFPDYRPDMARTGFAVSELGARYRVLVVDDDAAICGVIRDSLQDWFDVVETHSADEAMKWIRSDRPHLIILDVSLPDGSGLELCRTLRANRDYQRVPIMFMTGYGADDAVVTALEAGGDDYLAKPFRLDELRARVNALLRRSAGTAESHVPA